ncbi:MAG: glycosyltransferase family 39 protein [Pseudomonadota bacterium]|nr:glycosyltransferase family 39 protein [Pseudomonadota bacterium]
MSPRGREHQRPGDAAPVELVRARTVATPPYWLIAAAVLVTLPFLGKAPAIDEESYLWIAAHVDPKRPYDWVRTWPPYDGDAYAWAHPPLHVLWLKVCALVAPVPGVALRAVAGLPWIVLFAYSVVRLAARTCRHPDLAAAMWLASPIVLIGLHDTWMIDLPAVALATFAMAAYREGLVDEDQRWFVASGLALGLAIETKYSMAVLVPVLAVHMVRLGPRPWLWVALLAVVVGVEGPLWALYGRPHPWEVWIRRHDIEAGTLGARALGTLVRGALLALPLVLLRADPRILAGGLAVALVAVVGARPTEMPIVMSTMLVGLAGLGSALLVRAVVAVLRSPVKRRKGDRGDPLLLGGWVVATVLGVVFAHNYASARYLLPAAAPLALILTRSGEEVPWGKGLLRASAALSGAVALVLAVADYRFAAAGVEVARAAIAAAGAVEGGISGAGGGGVEGVAPGGGAGAGGRFAGEWSFRGAMEAAGWARYRPDEVLPAGTWVVVAENASAGTVDFTTLEPYRHVASADTFPVRVVDLDAGVGLYAETLGPLPFGWGRGPLEGATVYRVRGVGGAGSGARSRRVRGD